MRQSLINNECMEVLDKITYLVGNKEIIAHMPEVKAFVPFDEKIINFLNDLSKKLLSIREAKIYPDVVTLAFWMRKSSILNLKERFVSKDTNFHVGRGVAFHIAPSNVPVNYAYSLVTGLLTGNANVVRIPSKDFPQVTIINKAINEVLESYKEMQSYICLVRYGREQKINDVLSTIADVRIIWGGDKTIEEIRKSPLGPRAAEVTFADRYSLAVIDSEKYMEADNKAHIAEDFYNDTYLTDQNACTSPRIVIWLGNKKEEAKKQFWSELHDIVGKKYTFQSIQGINKLTSSYLMAVSQPGTVIEKRNDNLIVRVKIKTVNSDIMQLKDNSGYFFEYDCEDIIELGNLCNNTHCQTISYIGKQDMFLPLLNLGIKGVDRIVPVGKSMDFDLIWDGYNLTERLTRTISIS